MGWFDDDDDDDDDDNENDEERQGKKPKMMLGLMDLGGGALVESTGMNTATSTGSGSPTEHHPLPAGDDQPTAHPHHHPQQQSKSKSKSKSQQVQEGVQEEEEEEDPLDAYMKSLKDNSSSSSPSPSLMNKKKVPAARLDVENEDEATSHWQIPNNASEESTNINSNATAATATATASIGQEESRTAMDQLFHKASSSSSAIRDHRKVDIQLEDVQHTTMGYTPIQNKNLLTGTSTSSSQGHDWRREHSISCHPPLDPMTSFAQLRGILPDSVMDWIAKQEGMVQPTLVQAQTLPVALSGKDAIVTASTGSGKTLAYLFPLVAHLMANNNNNNNINNNYQNATSASSSTTKTTTTTTTTSRALVLVPTRELALQVEKVAKSLLSKIPKFSALAVTGGNMGRYQLSQSLLQRKPHLIVATPGRLLDVLSSQQKSKHQWLLTEITFLVLDEADKMLQLGFAPQVTQLLDNLRPDRQSLLTSATLHGRLEQHCQRWMQSPPTRISVGRSGTSSEHVQQHVVCLPTLAAKQAFLKESLPTFCQVGRTIVFCATREGCEQLAQLLLPNGNTTTTTTIDTAANANANASIVMPNLQTLHGDKHPSDRKAALKAFAKGQVKLLIATDVAGRGLDIPEVTTVINFDPAKNWDTHVHRIGRAGRLSAKGGANQQQEGSAYTLLTPRNSEFAQTLVQAYQREGREIGRDVEQLAAANNTNRHHQRGGGGGGQSSNSTAGNYYGGGGNGGGRGRGRGGLGFAGGSPSSTSGGGDSDASRRAWKKSRWS
jgi:ATP-dependent RNA helicase DDX42